MFVTALPHFQNRQYCVFNEVYSDLFQFFYESCIFFLGCFGVHTHWLSNVFAQIHKLYSYWNKINKKI